jgi:hypothetical protein
LVCFVSVWVFMIVLYRDKESCRVITRFQTPLQRGRYRSSRALVVASRFYSLAYSAIGHGAETVDEIDVSTDHTVRLE